MENHFLLNDELLWDYADGFLPDAERQQVDSYLQQYPEWKDRLDLIVREKAALFAVPLEKPNPGFADRVMAAWTSELVHRQATKPGRDWIPIVIAAVFGLFIIAPIVALIFNAAAVDTTGFIPAEVPTVHFDWTAVLGNSVFHYAAYFLLTVLSLRFLEQFLANKALLDKLGNQHVKG